MQNYPASLKGPLKITDYLDPNDITKISVFWGAMPFGINKVYRQGDITRPTVDNGYYYVCSTSGLSGSTEPTWNQADTKTGTTILTATSWDLWLLPDQTITNSVWTASANVNTQTPLIINAETTITIGPFDNSITQFELTNQITKSSGESLSRSFLYKTNQQ